MSEQLLQKSDGPECPKCGCTASEIFSRGTRWGQEVTKRQCGACGAIWTVIENPGVKASPIKTVKRSNLGVTRI